jgi:serine/threonine-protein kinase HSL1 (negative regulator of Swe1 kinase)
MPFEGNNIQQVFEKIKKGKFKMPRYRSKNAKDLISKMLELDPKKRITCEGILNHPFITEIDKIDCEHKHSEIMNSGIIKKLEEYRGRSVLKRELLHILVR